MANGTITISFFGPSLYRALLRLLVWLLPMVGRPIAIRIANWGLHWLVWGTVNGRLERLGRGHSIEDLW